jgi:hypothetical protein
MNMLIVGRVLSGFSTESAGYIGKRWNCSRPSHKTLKIDESDFHFSTATKTN